MTDYRLYCFNGAGGIGSGEWIEARNDSEAIAFARSKKLKLGCELWDRSRFVAKLEPTKA